MCPNVLRAKAAYSRAHEMALRPTIAEVAEQVSSSLVKVTVDETGGIIRTPLLFPSGSTVQVRIDAEEDSYFVSDMAEAFREAEMLGGQRTFAACAPSIADNLGVNFDRHMFFVAQVIEQHLLGTVMSIANCSAEAAKIVAHRIAEKKGDDYTARLQERLVEVFPNGRVQNNIEFSGASSTSWSIDASVLVGGQLSLFDVVNDHPNSVAAAVTKFSDIAALPQAPNRIAVLRKRNRLGTRLAVLARTADVLEFDAPDDTYRQLAHAA